MGCGVWGAGCGVWGVWCLVWSWDFRGFGFREEWLGVSPQPVVLPIIPAQPPPPRPAQMPGVGFEVVVPGFMVSGLWVKVYGSWFG